MLIKNVIVPVRRPVQALPPLLTLIRLRQGLLLQTVLTVREILFTRGLVLPHHVPLIRFLLVRLTEIVHDAATESIN